MRRGALLLALAALAARADSGGAAERVVWCPAALACAPVLQALDDGVVAQLPDEGVRAHWPRAELLYLDAADYARLRRAPAGERDVVLRLRRAVQARAVVEQAPATLMAREEALLRASAVAPADFARALERYRVVAEPLLAATPRDVAALQSSETLALDELASLAAFAPTAALAPARAAHAELLAELRRQPGAGQGAPAQRWQHVYALPASAAAPGGDGELRRLRLHVGGELLVAFSDDERPRQAQPRFASVDACNEAHDALPASLFAAEVARRRDAAVRAADVLPELTRIELASWLRLARLPPAPAWSAHAARTAERLRQHWSRQPGPRAADVRRQLAADLNLLAALAALAHRDALAARLRAWPRAQGM